MKDNLKKPCKECPFKKTSARGWLGGQTPQATFDHVVEEGNFACHMTRGKPKKQMSRCRGSLLFLAKMCKRPKYNKELAAAVDKIDSRAAMNDETILKRNEFIPHHTT